jgi:hypothetical protein
MLQTLLSMLSSVRAELSSLEQFRGVHGQMILLGAQLDQARSALSNRYSVRVLAVSHEEHAIPLSDTMPHSGLALDWME